MILCDTGVIVALVNKEDSHHRHCVDLMKTIRVQIVTTWPCVTEAMHLAETQLGQEQVRKMLESGFLQIAPPTTSDALRACALMRQYFDAPMDFADASLVTAAEILNITRTLTLDRHFYAYQIHGKAPFEVLPTI